MTARDNANAGKRSLAYNGHNRRPGVAAQKRAERWRRVRRRQGAGYGR